ncbi:serine protease [Vibrio sp. AND4]|uniref:S1 family peptidase n=1 Tax=Vibrio sp. AND4 TaxID=314289 RepID=UPI0005C723FC|nr:serine protease [Vibrio sp. AND4]
MPFVAAAKNNINDSDFNTFIIGGQQASANQLPFFARLVLHRTGSLQFANICGGTIVNDRYILTAAHCVESKVFTDGWTINDLRVLVKNPTMNDVFVEEFKDVRSIKIHPYYNADDQWINDIAILELTHPITDNVKSITLPQDFGDYSNRSVYQTFGLGLTSTNNDSEPNYLRWAEIQPLSDSECMSMIPTFKPQESLCANGFPGRVYTGICSGDSGGPLTYQDGNGDYQQIGVVSYGSSKCESPVIPSVFTEVLNYVPWIEAQTSAGTKTTYDESLAAIEGYHSQGDSGLAPEDVDINDSGDQGSNGGSIGFGWLALVNLFAWVRHQKARQR